MVRALAFFNEVESDWASGSGHSEALVPPFNSTGRRPCFASGSAGLIIRLSGPGLWSAYQLYQNVLRVSGFEVSDISRLEF
jgi:hypothetical protein